MQQQDLEQRIISIIKDDKKFKEILSTGIDSESFIMHTEVFDFIQKQFNNYKLIPAESIIVSTFPGFSYLKDANESEIKFLCDELIKAKVKRKAISIINTSADLLSADTYGTIDSMIIKLSSIRKNSNYSRSFADADAMKRYEKVIQNRERVAKGVTVGIKTGISFFDEKYVGWQPGNLIGIVGRLGVGKSFVAEYLACQSYSSGKRILFLSPELSVDEVDFRWDTMMGTINGYSFWNDKLLTGDVNLMEYKEWLEKVSRRKDWLTLDSASGKSFTVGNISGLVSEFSPDLVVVDGVALISDNSDQRWEKIMNVSYGLKSIAQNNKIVVIATSQASRGAGDEMPRPDQVSFGDAFAQAVDDLIMLQRDVNNPDIRYAVIPKRRTGPAINSPITINFDVNKGLISL